MARLGVWLVMADSSILDRVGDAVVFMAHTGQLRPEKPVFGAYFCRSVSETTDLLGDAFYSVAVPKSSA